MTVDEVRGLLDRYVAWLKDKSQVRQLKDWVEITTPYLDRHNDYLQIYAKSANGGFLLSDGGYVLEDLQMSGCSIDTPKRQALLQMTLNGFGVQRKQDDSLEVHAGEQNFPLRKHNLVQAMLAVNDLFFLASPIISSLFYEDVVAWLDEHDVRYTPTVKFTGRSGYDHHFDFVIPKSRRMPERIVETINRPSKETAQALAFSWIDTKDVRPVDSRVYAILNDQESRVPSAAVDALRNYDVHVVLWSERTEISEELAA
jgi:hypothetical protein